MRPRPALYLPAVLLLCQAVVGCGGAADPVRQLARELEQYPEYSIVVDDLRIDDGMFPDYFLRLRALTGAGRRVADRDTLVYEERRTDWYPVEQHVYARYENYVGMTVASKSLDGRRTGTNEAHPPAYGYVGNPRYGFWGAGGFWQFYGQYALMRDLLGGWQVNRTDYDDYRRHRDRRTPYFGPASGGRPAFGSSGTVTQKSRPSFYQRHTARRQAFANRARTRMTTTRSSWGSRSFRGK